MNIKRIFPKLFTKIYTVEIIMQSGAVLVLDKVIKLDYKYYNESGRFSEFNISQLPSAKRFLLVPTIQLDQISAITVVK